MSDRKQRIRDFLEVMCPQVLCPPDLARTIVEEDLSVAQTVFELGCAFQRQTQAGTSKEQRLLEAWDRLQAQVLAQPVPSDAYDVEESLPVARAVCEAVTVPEGVELVVMLAPVHALEHPETGHRCSITAETIGVLTAEQAEGYSGPEIAKGISSWLSGALGALQKRSEALPGSRAFFCVYWPPMHRTAPAGPYSAAAVEQGGWSMRGAFFLWERPDC